MGRGSVRHDILLYSENLRNNFTSNADCCRPVIALDIIEIRLVVAICLPPCIRGCTCIIRTYLLEVVGVVFISPVQSCSIFSHIIQLVSYHHGCDQRPGGYVQQYIYMTILLLYVEEVYIIMMRGTAVVAVQ